MSALVLIAASDPKTTARLRAMVDGEGGRVITAGDANEAMRLFVRSVPDLTLIYDLGAELCSDMKALRDGRRRAVLVVGERQARKSAFDARCDAFLLRQTDGRPLQRAVRRFIQMSRPRTVDRIESVGL